MENIMCVSMLKRCLTMVETNWGYNLEANCPQAETEERWGVKTQRKDLTGELCVRALFT